MTSVPTARPRKHTGGRRKGATVTREAIIEAAVELFAERGYEGTTLRAITTKAEVDVALVSHFFGGKQGLFEEAVLRRADDHLLLIAARRDDVDPVTQLLEAYFSMWENPETARTVRAVFRAALESDDARDRLQQLISAKFTASIRTLFAEHGGTETADTASIDAVSIRAQLLGAQLMGLGIARYIMQYQPLAGAAREDLIAELRPVIEAYLPARGR